MYSLTADVSTWRPEVYCPPSWTPRWRQPEVCWRPSWNPRWRPEFPTPEQSLCNRIIVGVCLFLIYCPHWNCMSPSAQISLQKDLFFYFYFTLFVFNMTYMNFCFILFSIFLSLIFIGWIFEIDFLHNQTEFYSNPNCHSQGNLIISVSPRSISTYSQSFGPKNSIGIFMSSLSPTTSFHSVISFDVFISSSSLTF